MSDTPGMRTIPRARPIARFLAARLASDATPFSYCVGETVSEICRSLERSPEPGHYRVFDRRPAARGIDAEFVGLLDVQDGGSVRWKPLRAF